MWIAIIGVLVAIATVFVAGTVQLGIGETVLSRITGLALCLVALLCFVIFISVVREVIRYTP